MSRWLIASYKRQALDATPAHENIERQWEAEQWQKEMNRPAIVETVSIKTAVDQIKGLIDKGLIEQAIDALNNHDYERGSDLLRECLDKSYLKAQVQLHLTHTDLPSIDDIETEINDILSKLAGRIDRKAFDLLYSIYASLASTKYNYHNAYSSENGTLIDYTDMNNMRTTDVLFLLDNFIALLVLMLIITRKI